MSDFCKKCGRAFVQVSVDTYGKEITAPSCECWLEDAYEESKRREDHYSDEDLPSEPPDFEDEDFDYFDEYYYDTPSEVNQNLDFHMEGLEENSVQQYAQLRSKYESYGLKKCIDQEITSPLFRILISVDIGRPTDKINMLWLKKKKCFQFLGFVHCQNYLKTKDSFESVMACSCYRKAGLPKEGIKVSYNFTSDASPKIMRAIYTTRGAAHKDIKEHHTAIRFADMALKIDPNNYKPHNLLGAIYFSMGQFEEGMTHFKRAEELGSNNRTILIHMETSLDKLTAELQHEGMLFLLNIDKVLYGWARKYIKHPSQIHP